MHAEIAELRARIDHLEADGDPAPIKPEGDWKTVGEIAYETGYSESGIRRWIKYESVRVWRHGGHVYIDARTVPSAKVRKNV